jgi:DNA ligase 1
MALIWRPTLSATLPVDADLSALPYPLWASPKYDGMRALVQGGKIVSRNGLVIPNRSACEPIEALALEGYDGELVVGNPTAPDVRNRTMSYLSKHGRVETGEVSRREQVTYFVFDRFRNDLRGYGSRVDYLGVTGKVDGFTTIQIVSSALLEDERQLKAYESRRVAQGHEGVMLRRCHKSSEGYMQKRSTLKEFELVKWKRWEHSEAVIVAVHPLEHNLNLEKTAAGRKSTRKASMVQDAALYGSATLRDVKTGKEFSVQIPGAKLQAWSGWPKSERTLSLIGKVRLTYKFQPGAKGVPIHPTCSFSELGVE